MIALVAKLECINERGDREDDKLLQTFFIY
jgi:hypothetical protein